MERMREGMEEMELEFSVSRERMEKEKKIVRLFVVLVFVALCVLEKFKHDFDIIKIDLISFSTWNEGGGGIRLSPTLADNRLILTEIIISQTRSGGPRSGGLEEASRDQRGRDQQGRWPLRMGRLLW
ncbi:hypothetical protein QVD17_37758 [Tagetes erecta]|uniref:Uncharacterized protein n=1 Tax=Tagetes erecta TaxID=13708 RepID=A0AAD8NJH5_TARER|nr:hypothetical protein QVD17_37758 [Tagetes erecta]